MQKLVVLSLFAMSLAAVNGVAAGNNLVTNGNFATGDFTGWTTHTCPEDVCSAQGWFVSTNDPYNSTFAAGTACVDASCNDPVNGDWIAQTLPTSPTQLYTLSFAYDSASGPTTSLNVYWNGVLIDTLLNIQQGYHVYTIAGLTPGAEGTTLEFTGRNDPAVIYLDDVSVIASGPGSYTGVFYNSTAPENCSALLTPVCTANNTAGVKAGPVFVFVNNGSAPITNGAFNLVDGDSYQVGTIPANSSVTVIPGISNDGQTHPEGGFFAVTGSIYDSAALGPNSNTTQFVFTGQQNGAQIESLDLCGSLSQPAFTPACTAGPSNDETVTNPPLNFLGGPGDNTGPCSNCFGPAVVARMILISSGGALPLTITSGAPPASGTLGLPYGPFTFTPSGGSGSYLWSVSGVAGLTVNSSTGVLSGTPAGSRQLYPDGYVDRRQ